MLFFVVFLLTFNARLNSPVLSSQKTNGDYRIISKMRRIAANKFTKHLGSLFEAEFKVLDEFLTKTDNEPLRYVFFFYFAYFSTNKFFYSSAITWGTAEEGTRMDCKLFAEEFALALGYNEKEASFMSSGAAPA